MNKYLLILPFVCATSLLKAQTDTVNSKISKIPYKHVDAIARFPQGDFKTYITHSLQINHTVEYNVKGQIILLMGIGSDGSISNVSVLKSLSPQIDPEVVQVINASPKWKPATLNDQNVSMDMVLNIDIAVNGIKPAPTKPVLKPITQPVLAKAPVPVIKKTKPLVTTPVKKAEQPIVKKPAPVIAKKVETTPIKKPARMVVKKLEPPIVKKAMPVIAKKIELLPVKKPAPVIPKKVEPPVVKKPTPIIAKKVEAPPVKKPVPAVAKKIEPPVIKKPVQVIARKVEPTPVKKTAPVIIKKAEPVKKSVPIVAKKNEPSAVKQQLIAKQPDAPVKRAKRLVTKMDFFHPTSNDAVFPGGGIPAFFRYLGENIAYPPGSKYANIEGKVLLSFTVEEDGSINDVEVESSPAEDLSQEAIRVLLASPKWKPASQNGRSVAVSYTIPIKFTLAPKTN